MSEKVHPNEASTPLAVAAKKHSNETNENHHRDAESEELAALKDAMKHPKQVDPSVSKHQQPQPKEFFGHSVKNYSRSGHGHHFQPSETP